MSRWRDRPLLSGILGTTIAVLAGLVYAQQMGRDPLVTVGVATSIYTLFHIGMMIPGRRRP